MPLCSGRRGNEGMNRLINIWKNRVIILISLVLATGLWLYVIMENYPDDTKEITGISVEIPFEGSTPEQLGLVMVGKNLLAVNVVLEGPRALLMQVTREKITAKVNLNNVQSPANHTLPIEVTVPEGLTVRTQSPQEITIPFDKLAGKQVPVKVHTTGTVPEGYVLDNPVPVPDSISLEGPESEVKLVSYAQVNIDVTGYQGDITLQELDYSFYKEGGEKIAYTGFTVDSTKVALTLAMLKLRELPVKVPLINTSGGNESGYAVVSIQPSVIAVAGPASIVDALNSVELPSVDTCSLSELSEFDLSVVLPNGLRNQSGSNNVKAIISFEKATTKSYTVRTFAVRNAPAGKTVTVSTASLYIKVRGLASTLSELRASNIKAVVDLEGKSIDRGRRTVPVKFEFPDGTQAGVMRQYTCVINVK